MATFDLTASSTLGVGADSIAVLPSAQSTGHPMRLIEGIVDFGALSAAGNTIANGDVFQALEIPAGTMVLFAGAEVKTAVNGTTPLVNIGFAAGDTIIDGDGVGTTGFLVSGTNGGPNDSDAGTFTQFVSTTDTIDVTLSVTGNPTAGVIRVYACVVDCNSAGSAEATEVDRDQLA
jgi:hypothetical protein